MAPAPLVDRASEQLLAAARGSQQQDRRIGRRDLGQAASATFNGALSPTMSSKSW
jgi:hypothetical protein